MKRVFWAKDIRIGLMAKDVDLSYIAGEVEELKEELIKRDLKEAAKEWDDVTGLTCIWIYQMTGINLPIIRNFGRGAVLRWYDRNIVWKEIFKYHGIPWEQKVLGGGSNFNKISKIKKAVKESKEPAVTLDWKWIKSEVGHFEDEHLYEFKDGDYCKK